MQYQAILTFLRKYWLFLVGLIIGILMSWYIYKPLPPTPEIYAPEIKQPDGSVVLEKKPDAEVKPVATLPKGAKIERVVKLTVKSKNPFQSLEGTLEVHDIVRSEMLAKSSNSLPMVEVQPAPELINCAPVNVELDLVKMPDNTERVIVSSEDGEILGGVDIPVNAATAPIVPKLWSAGVVIDPIKQLGGVYVDRDLGPFRLGIQVNQRDTGKLPDQVWVKVGINF